MPLRCRSLVLCILALTACASEPRSSGSESEDPPASASAAALEDLGAGPAAEDLPDDLLLPNMRSVGASDLRVVRERGERRLRFAGSLANLGVGPMVVRPRVGSDCRSGQISAQQVLYRDTGSDGGFHRPRDPVGLRRDAGCMLDHPTHGHWHFDAMAAYSLQRPSGDVVVERDKVSFCLRDNERAQGASHQVRRAYFGECGRREVQGISPGWVDIYAADLDGQYLTLPPRTPRGTMCLVITADPYDQLVESDESDNATTIPIQVRGMRVSRVVGRACA